MAKVMKQENIQFYCPHCGRNVGVLFTIEYQSDCLHELIRMCGNCGEIIELDDLGTGRALPVAKNQETSRMARSH
jgi:predicted RNA-binding Zn-ribbon protein involved in translation (DUF1610 family)